MQENYGLIRVAKGRAELRTIPVPDLRDDYMLVRTVALALNPTDWTSLEAPGENGSLVGCDYSGVVEQVGPAVTRPFRTGDRVAGFAHGANDANHQHGAFAKYIAVKGDIQMHIPAHVDFDEAATVGAGCGSAAYALYRVLGLPQPQAESSTAPDAGASEAGQKTILIYGGSTATGTLAIQFAKLSGWRVMTTSSPTHFELLKTRGADAVFDYREAGVGESVRRASDDSIQVVLDCIASESSAAICAQAMTSDCTGSKKIYCSLLPVQSPRTDVESVFFLGYAMSGEAFIAEAEHFAAQPDAFEFARDWYAKAETLWAAGRWTAHPQEVRTKGLNGIELGLRDMKEGKVRGVKLVYRVPETEWPVRSS